MIFALQGIGHKVGHLGYWAAIVTYAIRTGFAGALSTVSTFVAEVRVFAPPSARMLALLAASTVPCIGLVLLSGAVAQCSMASSF